MRSQPSPSAKRRRLHILYVINDLLHHTKYHLDGNVAFSTVSGSLQPFMVDLLGHAAVYDGQKHPKHHGRLEQLLGIWISNRYFGLDLLQKLREVVRNGAAAGPALPSSNDISTDETDTTKKQFHKDTPTIVPSTHGDSAMPRHDLPAGNFVPHVIPNSSIPVYADNMKPLQLLAGPAAAELVQTMKCFLKDVDLASGTEELVNDGNDRDIISGLALRVPQNEITGNHNGSAYFAWTPAFDQQIQEGSPDASPSHSNWSRSRSRSRSRRQSRSWSRSRSPSEPRNYFKRRRDSDSSLSHDGRRLRTPPWRQHQRNGREEYRGRSRSPREDSYSPPPPNFPPPVPGAWPGPPPPMPLMAFPPPGPWAVHSTVPIPFPGPPPPMPMPSGQPLPGGQFHFPPPHSGNQRGNSWGGRGRGGLDRG